MHFYILKVRMKNTRHPPKKIDNLEGLTSQRGLLLQRTLVAVQLVWYHTITLLLVHIISLSMGRHSSSSRRERSSSPRRDEDRSHRHRDDGRRERKKHRKDEESGEDRKSRKHRRRNSEDGHDPEEERRRRKRHKKHRHEERSHKKDKKKKKEKSAKHAQRNLISLGPPRKSPPAQLLDADKDYFAFHEHLWVYLFREKGLAFNDMTSEETRDAFRGFVKRYNAGDLAEGYYVDKLPAAVLEESKTTKHSWSFRVSETESRSLHSIEAGVRAQTEYKDPSKKEEPKQPSPYNPPREKEPPRSHDPEVRVRERVANRRLKEHVRTAEEEFSGGRKEGRERMIEKRREVGARTHGAARDREAAVAGPEVGDDVLYGGGDEDKKMFARERERSEKRRENREKRISELEQKEKDKQEAMLKQLGLANIKPGQKITIQPRRDG